MKKYVLVYMWYSSGYIVLLVQMIREMCEMKFLNVNAICASHYPQNNLWYDLCDLSMAFTSLPKSSMLLGRYSHTVAGQFYPYIRPQENGTKSDIRW